MIRALTRRAVTVGVAGVAIVGLAAGPAAAHFCFKTELNERAAEGVARSANWVSFEDLATEFLGPLCPQAIDYLAEAGGVTADTMINTHGTMAGGTLKKSEPGNKAISYLNFEALDAAIPAAVGLCQTTSS